jgi:hypothetical protein
MSYPTSEIVATAPEPFTEQDFIHGRVEAITTPGASIFMTWPHGDETLGPRTAHRLYSEYPGLLEATDYLCGNPAAAQQDPPARYIEEDLNRSYLPGSTSKSYEHGRALQTLRHIQEGGYRHILDVHTTTVEQADCMIISNAYLDTAPVQEIIAASPVSHIVVFPPEIALQGLIGNVPGSVSIEYNRELADRVGVNHLITTLQGLTQGAPTIKPHERGFYYVEGVIPKSEDPGLDAKNFELCKDGYYPVLFGENSYRTDPTKSYLGFRAVSRELVTV